MERRTLLREAARVVRNREYEIKYAAIGRLAIS